MLRPSDDTVDPICKNNNNNKIKIKNNLLGPPIYFAKVESIGVLSVPQL